MDFSVMTFNLRNCKANDGDNSWPYRIHRVVETMKAHDPLLIGIQEGYHSMLEELEPDLSDYDWLGEGREGGTGNEYCAIWFKKHELTVLEQGQFWLSETPSVVGSKSWDSSLPRICTWAHFRFSKSPEHECVLFNTHLDHKGQEAREQGIRLIWQAMGEHLAKGLPVILMGDFNVRPHNQVVQFMHGQASIGGENANMTDAYHIVSEPVGTTFHGFSGGTDGEPIDYIFVSPNVKVLQTTVDRRSVGGGYPSDHYPVAARIRLK